ncbi:MAG: DEAD/DEAH box helicase [Bacteroidia bacterium]|nr:DEAD/DEAH box helicase [Bacteroidia bacterium]
MYLRGYQKAAIAGVFKSWDSGNTRIILTVPTGGGKTVIAANIIKELAHSGRRVLMLINRMELAAQTAATLNRLDLQPSIITANSIHITNHSVAIAMHATLKNRLNKKQYFDYFSNFTHIIIDECHYGDFRWVFEHEALKNAKVLGLTATPIAAKKDTPLKNIYHDIIEPVSVKELIAEGALVPARYFSGKRDLSGLQIKGGEFTENSQEAVFAGKACYDDVIGKYIEFCEGRQCIVFNTTQRMAVELAAAFNEKGIKAAYLISGNEDYKGTSDAERKSILEAFKRAEIQVITNTAILTAGFDAPICSAIILNFATLQRAKYVQCIGRGARPYPNKQDFVIVDMGENHYRFGLFDMMWERKGKVRRLISSWAELFWNPILPSEGLPPVKDCPSCVALVAAQAKTCPNCGYVFPVKPKEYVKKEFAEINIEKCPEKMIRDWIYLAKSKRFAGGENFVLKKIRENLGVEGLYLYANIVGRQKSWADAYYRSRKEKLWADIKRIFPITAVQNCIAADIRKQLESKVDFFKIEIHYREKVLSNPSEYLRKFFLE